MKKFFKFQIVPEVKESNDFVANVVISPLDPGFGTTLGNSLRRVLLSSIPSAAVFAIKINSLSHEFCAIDGVFEDVTNIIINIKKLAIKVDEKIYDVNSLEDSPIEKWPTIKISKNKKGIIYASDIETIPGIEIMNKDLKICELTEDVEFNLDLYVTVNRGFKNFLENSENLNTLKIISIDSLFSPILKVEWKVVEEKITKQGISDKLYLNVATNGTIKALDAISYAAKILIEHYKIIADFDPKLALENLFIEKKELIKKSLAATTIDTLGLTMRSFNCLKSNGINTVTELISISKDEAEKIKNLGKKSLNEIIEKLASQNLSFKN